MDSYSAIARFKNEYLSFPPFARAMEEVDSLLQLYRQTGIAKNLLIQGESGTGKTTLCLALRQKYPQVSLAERDLIPVLHVPIPAAATVAGMLEVMLEKLGDPSPSAGTNSAKAARFIKLARACGVELMLFDEGQHVQDRGKHSTQYLVGDCIKMIVDEVGVPTVLLGLPRVEMLLRVNEQLRRRFTCRLQMALGQHTTFPLHMECLQLFTSLAPALPVPLTPGNYDWDEFGRRLHAATDGRVGYVKVLLLGAIGLVFRHNLKEISPRELETAFTEEIWDAGIGPLNPFNEEFEFRQLRRVAEPFEPTLPATTSRRRRENAAV
jgi:hypothetical protein